MEAEHLADNIAQGQHTWQDELNPAAGFSGAGTLETLPNNGTSIKTNYAATSPRLDYSIAFLATGTHYVWVRGVGPGGGSNSVHVGLDGQQVSTAEHINIPKQVGYIWSDGADTLEIPSTGVHTLNVWMREDGTLIDKIVLTTDSTFTPTGTGPDESPR